MKKGHLIVTGLAVVGVVSALWYFGSKPRKNSDGFYNATGAGGGCDICVSQHDGVGYWAVYGTCRKGDKCRRSASIASA